METTTFNVPEPDRVADFDLVILHAARPSGPTCIIYADLRRVVCQFPARQVGVLDDLWRAARLPASADGADGRIVADLPLEFDAAAQDFHGYRFAITWRNRVGVKAIAYGVPERLRRIVADLWEAARLPASPTRRVFAS